MSGVSVLTSLSQHLEWLRRRDRSILHETVPHSVDSLDIPGPSRIGLDLAPEVFDVRVHAAVKAVKRYTVNRLEQLLAAEDSSRLADQRGQQLELGGRQIHGLAGELGCHGCHVQLHITSPDHSGRPQLSVGTA